MKKEQTKFTNYELIMQVQTLYRKIKRIPSAKDFNDAPYAACYITVKKQFGSWREFLLAAGIICEATKEDLILSYQELAKKLHHVPSADEFLKYRKDIISIETIRRLFGGMRNLIKEAGVENENPYTEEAMITQLHSLVHELGYAPSEREFDEAEGTINSRTVLRRFGSWKTFLATAGYDYTVKYGRPHAKKKSKDKNGPDIEAIKQCLISELRTLGEQLRRIPSASEFESANGGTTRYYVKKVFGSWANFIDASGIQELVAEILKEELLQDMRNLADNLERTPNENEFRITYSSFRVRLVRKYFDSWPTFIQKAGLDSMAKSKRKVIIRQFLALKEELGRTPTKKEFDQHLHTVTVATVLGYFDSWDNLAIEAMQTAI